MDDLTGTLVLVHPLLTHDPVGRQGQTGIITGTDLAKDEIYVGFGSASLGLYSSDALLVLKSHDKLYEEILTNIKNMTTPDFKALLEITLLQDRNTSTTLRDALDIAKTNSDVLAFSTVSLHEQLGIQLAEDVGTENKASLSR